MPSEILRRRRKRLLALDPHCHWCGGAVVDVTQRGGTLPPNAATLDHLRSRLDPRRREPPVDREARTVLACHACNQRRGREEHEAVTLEARRARSGAQPGLGWGAGTQRSKRPGRAAARWR